MSYGPVYALIALVLLGGLALFGLRSVRRWRGARQRRSFEQQRVRNAETWARRNDHRPR